jgi:hypothetical protein
LNQPYPEPGITSIEVQCGRTVKSQRHHSSAAVRVVLARWGIPDAVERELEEAKDVSLATASQPPETRPGKLNRPVNHDQAWPRAGQAGPLA